MDFHSNPNNVVWIAYRIDVEPVPQLNYLLDSRSVNSEMTVESGGKKDII